MRREKSFAGEHRENNNNNNSNSTNSSLAEEVKEMKTVLKTIQGNSTNIKRNLDVLKGTTVCNIRRTITPRGPRAVVFFKIGTFCRHSLAPGENIFVDLSLFVLVFNTNLTNNLKFNDKFTKLQSNPTFHSEERLVSLAIGRERFVGLSTSFYIGAKAQPTIFHVSTNVYSCSAFSDIFYKKGILKQTNFNKTIYR